MKLSGEPRAPVALPWGKEPPVAIGSGAGGVLDEEWTVLPRCDPGIDQLVNQVIMLSMLSRLHLHPLPRVRMSESVNVLPINLHGVHMETFISSHTLVNATTRPFNNSSINQSFDQSCPPTIH